jgi:hypothetical protein
MRKVLFVSCCLLVFGSAAMAQDKIDSKWHCKQTEEQKYDIGDQPDHVYAIAKGTCDASSSSVNEKSGAWTEMAERWKSSGASHGRFTSTTDSGDKIYYSYEVTASFAKKTGENKLKITGGTGKYKGIKGSETCSGTFGDDNTSDWTCAGTYTTGAAK